MIIIGVDPGGTTGIFGLWLNNHTVMDTYPAQSKGVETCLRIVQSLSTFGTMWLAVESFVVGPRAAKSASSAAGQEARDIITALKLRHRGVRIYERPAVVVKRWATNQRLEAAGLLAITTGMPHARDASRHALYSAVREGYLPDPLSRSASRSNTTE